VDAILISPSTLLNIVLGVLVLALLLAVLGRNTPPPPTVVVSTPPPEYLRRDPGVGSFLALVAMVFMVFVLAGTLSSCA
jgi:hypothetical protein